MHGRPRRIPAWMLSREETQELHAAGHGTTPDLFYAKGVPDSPSPDPTSFNKKLCTLIIIEVEFCQDLGCEANLEAKTTKYAPILAALKKHWGRVEFVAFPIGHAEVTLTQRLTHLTAAFSTVRSRGETSRASRGITNPDTDNTAKAHDYILFKSLLDSLTDLTQSRLLGIISNRKRLVEALPRNNKSIRANSAVDKPHTKAITQQETASHTHTQVSLVTVPESTAII